MSAREILKAIGKKLRHPAVGCVLISLLVVTALLAVRRFGWLQRPELIVYDTFVKWRSEPASTDDRIVIVGMTEDDLEKYGFPISDASLAKVLRTISEQNPAVTGLDIYRDQKEPRSGLEYPELAKVFEEFESIVPIERVGFVQAPAFFRNKDTEHRVSANNLPKDFRVDGVYRRAPLFVEQNGRRLPSFSLLLASMYLIAHEVECVPEEAYSEEFGRNLTLLRIGKVLVPRMDANAGGYVDIPLSDDYEYLANFQKPLRHQRQPVGGDSQSGRDTPHDYTFGEVLEGKLPAGALTGKVVLVATVMQSIKDSNPTPIHENLRGVQYHAMLVHQLLETGLNGRAPMKWWSDRGEALWIGGCTLVGGLLGLWLRSPWKLVPGLSLALTGIGYFAWKSFMGGTWILSAIPALGCFLAAALVTSYVVALERADRRAVVSILGKHVSKKVAVTLMKQRDQFIDGGKMPPRAFRGTVIFTDLAGFSTASEKLTAVQTMRWLNEYMDVMAQLVEQYEGTINKYIGDAIMAVFGAPIVHTEDSGVNSDAVLAIRCALHMRRSVPLLNERWKKTSPDMPPVAMRVGIFTGPLVDGSFGTAQRMEWTVIGDTVNRANRLEAAGKEIKDQLTPEEKLCSILIGPETFARVGHLFETVAVPDMALKGISERATVYRVLSERAPS